MGQRNLFVHRSSHETRNATEGNRVLLHTGNAVTTLQQQAASYKLVNLIFKSL